MAIASGIGEEIFFRGFLSVAIGIWLSAFAFGVLHQVRGSGRLGWALSAFGVGVALGVIYALTGQLWGCIAAHIIINVVNLRYMRDHDPDPRPRKLGGLLRQT
jgi:membrane protease YdiL (CAAX protease family)